MGGEKTGEIGLGKLIPSRNRTAYPDHDIQCVIPETINTSPSCESFVIIQSTVPFSVRTATPLR